MWIQQAGGETPDSAFRTHSNWGCPPRSQIVEAVAPCFSSDLRAPSIQVSNSQRTLQLYKYDAPSMSKKFILISFNVVKMGCPASPSGSRRD